jgi:hypothetical protein
MNLFLKEKPLRKLLFALTVSALLPVGAHAFCYGVSDPISPISPSGNVCGTVFQRTFDGYSFGFRTGSMAYVMLCPAGSPYYSSACRTTNTSSYDDGYGNGNTVQAFTFYHFRQGASGYAYYDFYAWGAGGAEVNWGSSTQPISRIQLGGSTPGIGMEGISLSMPPRPFAPNPVYPAGSAVGSSYTVTWQSGLDLDRTPYPMNYEVWYKYWPFGGTEPASWTLSRANMPCQDNGGGPSMGRCSTYVAGPQPPGNWAWYVVANLNVGSQTSYPNTIFTTTSGPMYFTEPVP